MYWGWMIVSVILGAVFLPSHVAAANRKTGAEAIFNKPGLILFLAALGACGGWGILYYAPLAFYRAGVAFVTLYNDPRNPLLLLVPRLVGFAVALAFAYAGIRAWRSSVRAQKEKLHRLSTAALFLSLALWLAAFCILMAGLYVSLEMQRNL
ncbi:MAG: hypothetical protein J0I98_10110 [Mesorhizobium sp.]|nr:hypothetical protein [Mesorhizobium sp.]MBN9243136.1 hypothetical protein [Mesorhizobium sp.]